MALSKERIKDLLSQVDNATGLVYDFDENDSLEEILTKFGAPMCVKGYNYIIGKKGMDNAQRFHDKGYMEALSLIVPSADCAICSLIGLTDITKDEIFEIIEELNVRDQLLDVNMNQYDKEMQEYKNDPNFD